MNAGAWFSWSWRQLLFAGVITLPAAAIIAFVDVEQGLHVMVGSLLASIVGLAPTRKKRLSLAVVGLLFAVFVMLGSFAAQWWWLGIPTIFGLGYGAAILASRKSIGMVIMTLGVPLSGIGFSYPGLQDSGGLAALVLLGSVIACAIAMLFPTYSSAEAPKTPLLAHAIARDYGIRLGLAGATGAAIGFAFSLDHIGWVMGAALLVMRPNLEAQKLRAAGRIVSVIVGAMAASWLLGKNLSAGVIAALAAGDLMVAAAMNKSRWYITSAFTTFLVFWSLLYGEATTANITY